MGIGSRTAMRAGLHIMVGRILVGAALGAGSLGLASPAAAAPPKDAAGEVAKQAQQLFDAAKAAEKAGDWERARTFLLSSYRAQRDWKVAAHVGNVANKLRRWREAAEYLTYLLREAPPGALSAEDRAEATKMLAKAKAKVGALSLRVSPPGAEVRVEGEVVEASALGWPVFVEAGVRRVEVRAEGYAGAEQVVQVKAGDDAVVEVRLAAVPKAAPAVASGGPGAGANRGVVIAGAATTGAGLALGAGFVAASFVKAGVKSQYAQTDCYSNDAQCLTADRSRVALANASFYSFIAAGVVGGATLTYALAARKPQDKEGGKVGLKVSPAPGGLVVSGTW